ncbi:MAG: Alkaline phosphatase [Alphaproteobacteria bacterium]|jgi:hypothetical protein|nr:Alkaline phosphatase [Alphaproteobacteria bacterium]
MFSKLFFGLAFIFTLTTAQPATAETPPAFKDKEYLAAVDAAIKAQGAADWKTIRQLYIESSFYDKARRHGMGGTLMSDFGRKAAETKTPEAIALYKENARKYAGAMDTHVEAFGLIEKYKSDFLDLAYSKAAFKGLLDALMATGDGRSMKTAFKVASTSEEYILMRSVFRLTIRGKTLEQGNGEMFDIHKVSNEKGEDVGDIFFNISLFFGKMELPPELTKKMQEAMRANPPPAGPRPAPPPVPETDRQYLALVDAAIKNPAQGNWNELRRLYPETTFYKRVGGINLANYGRDMTDYVAKRMTPEAISAYKKFQREHFASAGAHHRARTLHKAMQPEFIDPALEQYALDGLLRSLAASGDGKTKETAFKTLSVDEASYLLEKFFKSTPDMKVDKQTTAQYLAFTGKDKDTGAALTIYFLLDPRAVAPPETRAAPPAMSRMTITIDPNAQDQPPEKEAVLSDPRNPDATKVSYLLLDLNGDGIKFGSIKGKEAIYWDIDADQFAEATAWPHDAFLAIDLDGNGKINGNEELFGFPSTNSLDTLALRDDNKDGRLDAKDKIWPQLLLWQDNDRNGSSEVIELSSMAEKKIDAIDLKIDRTRKDENGNTVLGRTNFYMTGADGKPATRSLASVFLEFDDLNTFDMRSRRIDPRAMLMPQLRGYGVLGDLHTAMSRDRELMAQVRDLSLVPLGSLVADPASFAKKVDAILFGWAGASKLDPASRGPNIDARRLKFTEKMSGEKFAQIGAGGLDNPLFFAANELNKFYTALFNNFYGSLAAQIYGTQIFSGKIYFDTERGELKGVKGLNIPSIAEISAAIEKSGQPQRRKAAWEGIVRIISAADENAFPEEDKKALDALIKKSDGSLGYAMLKEAIKIEDVRTLPGHDYATKKLGLSGKDGDIVEVIEQARQKDASKQIVYTDLANEILRACCKSEQEIVDYLTGHNFKIVLHPLESARKITGSHFAYTRALRAERQPTAMENLSAKFGSGPQPEYNVVMIFMNGPEFVWAYAHIQK